MLKNKIWLGITLSIFLLVFSVNGFTAYYKYTQESGANFYVGTGDKADAFEDTNQLRQIIDDLGALLVHSKRNDLYPKDNTTGGTIQIPEAGLKFSNAPVNNDIAAYIAGEMTWQTKAELGLDLSLYYLKTAIDAQVEVETIWGVTLSTDAERNALTYSDVGAEQADAGLTSLAGLTYVSPSFIKVTATDTYAIRTLAEVRTDLGLVIGTNVMAWDAQLDDIAALAYTDGNFIVGDGSNWVAESGSTARTSIGLGNVENLKVKLDGTQAPTVNNDTDEGYAVGSRWFNVTNDKEYVCLDNTDGAAVWTETTGAGGGASTFVALTDTPANYTGQAGKYIKVNAGEDALEYGTPAGGGTYLELTDTPAAYDTGKYAKSTADGVVWDTPSGGYINLTSFVDQTAWRLFYSNTDGDVVELALGTDGQYLKSTGATSAPIFDTPSGAGDMLKATYDADEDNEIDVAGGGTEKDSWTQYCIPYLSGTTTFGEIPIGTVGYVLKVSAGATGYEFAAESDPTVDSDAEIKAILVDEVTKTGDFTPGRMAIINNTSGIIEQGTNTDTDVADAVTKKHAANADTDLDATFEATFVKKADTVNVLSDITSAGADIEDAVTKKHTQNTDTQFDFYNALASDHTWSGQKDTQLVGESVVFGDLLYKDWAAGEWMKAQADVIGTTPALRIALESKADGETCLMLVKGYIRDDSAFDFGASRIFLNDDVAGTCDDTAPAESGDQIQVVGIGISADVLWFDPSIDVGEI
jgi:hypothetical protein